MANRGRGSSVGEVPRASPSSAPTLGFRCQPWMRQTRGLSSLREQSRSKPGMEEHASTWRKERAMQEEQRRVAKGQLTALMQAGHPWHERRRWQECRLVDPRTTNCCAMSVCEEMPPCRDIAHVSCYRPQSSEHLGRWSPSLLVRIGGGHSIISLT